jgi:hypothetical protein
MRRVSTSVAGSPGWRRRASIRVRRYAPNSADGAVARARALGRQHGLQRAEYRKRPAAQRSALGVRHAEQVADDLHGNRTCVGIDQVGRARGGETVEQADPPARRARLHRGDVPLRQRADDRPAHARVQRRVVEHEAGRVVLEQR